MGMWTLIIGGMLCIFCIGFLYLTFQFAKYAFWKKLTRSAKVARLYSALVLAAVFSMLYFLFGLWNMAIIMIHFVLIRLFCGGIGRILLKFAPNTSPRNRAGSIALLLTVSILFVGYVSAHRIERTEYFLQTQKTLPEGQLRIAAFSDAHVGTTFDGNAFAEYVGRINRDSPDLVLILGDFIDDNTGKEDMENACRSLSGLSPRYGTYFVFGNHDGGYFSEERRGYGRDDLIRSLEENGVTVLEDEIASPLPSVFLVGRRDRQNRDRKPIKELVNSADGYTIVLDHQPNDYANEAGAGCDLVLSGHTHGGQFFPINRVGELIGANDYTYGRKTIENTDFIVSSGIGDWELDFKTGCISEYVLITVSEK